MTNGHNGGNMENGNGTALAVAPRGEIISTQELRAGLAAAIEQQEILGHFVSKAMTEGIDYGTIPGTEKLVRQPDGSTRKEPNRTLLKPGAEKLVTLFRCRPRFKLRRAEDWDKGFFSYEFRCEILNAAGDVVAEGFGSANSREGRYRWRNAARVCPNCGKDTIIKGKAEFGGGWICFAKKGGCGAKFTAGDQVIEGQEQGRIENDDVASLANTILKMAKKRALVDAALALSRCSDLFGQDLEDLDSGAIAPPKEEPKAVRGERVATTKPSGNGAAKAKATAAAMPPTDGAVVGAVVDPFTGEVSDPTKPTTEELAAYIEEDMRAAGTLDELNALAAKVKGLPEAHRAWLRDVYRNRKGALEAAMPEPGSGG